MADQYKPNVSGEHNILDEGKWLILKVRVKWFIICCTAFLLQAVDFIVFMAYSVKAKFLSELKLVSPSVLFSGIK